MRGKQEVDCASSLFRANATLFDARLHLPHPRLPRPRVSLWFLWGKMHGLRLEKTHEGQGREAASVDVREFEAVESKNYLLRSSAGAVLRNAR